MVNKKVSVVSERRSWPSSPAGGDNAPLYHRHKEKKKKSVAWYKHSKDQLYLRLKVGVIILQIGHVMKVKRVFLKT